MSIWNIFLNKELKKFISELPSNTPLQVICDLCCRAVWSLLFHSAYTITEYCKTMMCQTIIVDNMFFFPIKY